jgi:hypothetical protein
MMRFTIAALILAPLLTAADDPAVKQFSDRVDQYSAIRKAAMVKVGAPPKNAKPEQLEKYEKALVQAIRDARPNAKQGDIFSADIQPLFNKLLKEHLAGPVNKENRDIAKQGNPKSDAGVGEQPPVIQVNAVYPKSASLSTIPPTLLLQLPKLPMDMEYRFVGNTLILWDNISNLIVDFMQGAAPGL